MFGKFQYAFIADISEMFVRIRLTEADKNTTDSGGMKTSGSGTEFCLGIGQAQTLVKKVIATHALKRKYSYPEASWAPIDDIYMDDTIVSHHSEVECVKIVETLPKVT